MINTIYDGNGNEAVVVESKSAKVVQAKDGSFNHFFNKQTGYSEVYGHTKEEDPDFSPFGPLIADIEITTICGGPGGKVCPHCYKSNSLNGTYMTLDTFKEVFKRLPKTIGQVALGLDASGTSNPDTWKIFEHCRENGVVPNLTIASISDDVADKIASLAGACAVSLYDNKDLCYDSVKKLTDRGMDQVNIHWCYTKNNIKRVPEIINDIKNDPRLEKLNAIVFLALKQKGRGKHFETAPFVEFKKMIDMCLENDVRFGLDSCGCNNFLKAVKDHPLYERFLMISEPCESFGLFSCYIDVHGDYYPCSFCPQEHDDWNDGISVLRCNNFIDDVWFSDKVNKWREISLKNKRNCPIFKL